ncbi:hypothetical protein Tco_0617379 [Tanacetum coccineum]
MAFHHHYSISYTALLRLTQANGPNFKVNFHRSKHYFEGNYHLGSSDLQTFPQGSINLVMGSSIVTQTISASWEHPMLTVVDCPIVKNFSACHSSRVSQSSLHL